MDQKGVSTNVIDSWYYWEYEQFIKILNKKNKEEQDQKKKQEEEQGSKYGNFNPSKLMNNFSPQNSLKNYGNMGSNSAFPRIQEFFIKLLFFIYNKKYNEI